MPEERDTPSTRIRLEEPITPFDTCRHEVSRVILDDRTPYQHMQIVESPTMGRALILDGRWQSSTSDAHIYHEPLVHASFLHHAIANERQGPKSVLIAGGGDWRTAHEALKWASVRRVVLAEIDERVLGACRTHFPEFHAGCEDDPRLEVVVDDAASVLETAMTTEHERFDIIIGDLSDPIDHGPSAELFTIEAYKRARSALTPGGIFTTQAGGISPAEVGPHARTRAKLQSVFERALTLIAPVQIFGTPLGIVIASDAPLDPNPEIERAARILTENRVHDLRYVDAQTFARSAFAPPYLQDAIRWAQAATAGR